MAEDVGPPRLSRNEIIAIITDFYVFCTKFYLPLSTLKFPPPGGWPNITPETTKDCGKAAIVIDVLKHLPYIDSDHGEESSGLVHWIHYKSTVVNYSAYTPYQFSREFVEDSEESMQEHAEEINEGIDNDPEDDDYISLSTIILFSQGHESGGRTLFLDVQRGFIYEDMERCSFLGGTTIEDFFANLKQKFEDLSLVPALGDMYEPEHGMDEDAFPILDIWEEYGWPGEGYKREEAIERVREFCENM
jgi:hypothetical protein